MRRVVKLARSRVLEVVILVVLAAILMAIFNVLLYSNIEILPTEEAFFTNHEELGKGKNVFGYTNQISRDRIQTFEGKFVANSVIHRGKRKHLVAVNQIQYKIKTVEKSDLLNDVLNNYRTKNQDFIARPFSQRGPSVQEDKNVVIDSKEYYIRPKNDSKEYTIRPRNDSKKYYIRHNSKEYNTRPKSKKYISKPGNQEHNRETNSQDNARNLNAIPRFQSSNDHLTNHKSSSRVIESNNNTHQKPTAPPTTISNSNNASNNGSGTIKNSKSSSVSDTNHASIITTKRVPSSTNHSRDLVNDHLHTNRNGTNDELAPGHKLHALHTKQLSLHTSLNESSQDWPLKGADKNESLLYKRNHSLSISNTNLSSVFVVTAAAAVPKTENVPDTRNGNELDTAHDLFETLSKNVSPLKLELSDNEKINDEILDNSYDRLDDIKGVNPPETISDNTEKYVPQIIDEPPELVLINIGIKTPQLIDESPVPIESNTKEEVGPQIINGRENDEGTILQSNDNESDNELQRNEGIELPGTRPKWNRILTMPSTGYHSFNITMSDNIGNSRPYPDMRTKACFDLQYDIQQDLKVSIIVVFHNEARSSLLRTIHSILDRTPEELFQELILIDDASTYPWLLEPLEDYVSVISNNIILIRMPRREGLIRARLIGADRSQGEVLVFLDAHVEVGDNWLPPMLTEIQNFPNTITVPAMDIVNWETFNFFRAKDNYQGSFLWDLVFRYKLLSKQMLKTRNNLAEPYPSPVMVGCAHALRRDYFFSMGAYDSGMEIWGGENLEHSFRTWMCGGRVMITPCSRVAHVFKPRLPYSFKNSAVETIQRNLVRVAEVWMDDYAKYFYALQENLPPIELKTLESRKKLRSQLNCKSFQWYLNNVAPDMPIPPITATYFGQLKSLKFPSKCIEFDAVDETLELKNCEQQDVLEQHYYFDQYGRFWFKQYCVTVHTGSITFSEFCSTDQSLEVTDEFRWRFDSNQISHVASKLCLTISQWDAIIATPCLDNRSTDRDPQQWEFSYKFNFTKSWNLSDILVESIQRPTHAVYFGALVNTAGSEPYCLRIFDGALYELIPCDKQPVYDQVLYLDTENYLRYKSLFLGYSNVTSSLFILPQRDLITSNDLPIETKWRYDATHKRLMVERYDLCLTLVDNGSIDVTFKPCVTEDRLQKWVFQPPLLEHS